MKKLSLLCFLFASSFASVSVPYIPYGTPVIINPTSDSSYIQAISDSGKAWGVTSTSTTPINAPYGLNNLQSFQKVWIDSAKGSDISCAIARPDLPCRTLNKAFDISNAAISAGKDSATAFYIGLGTYDTISSDLYYPNVSIVNPGTKVRNHMYFFGTAIPHPNSDTTRLVGGTVIRGGMSFNRRDIKLYNLGCDAGDYVTNTYYGGAGREACGVYNIGLDTNQAAKPGVEYMNIAGLVRKDYLGHAIIAENVANFHGQNLNGYYGRFGFVIKGTGGYANGVYAYKSLLSCVILKSNSYSPMNNFNLSNVFCDNGGGIDLDNADLGVGTMKDLYNITISNVNFKNTTDEYFGLFADPTPGGAKMYNIRYSNYNPKSKADSNFFSSGNIQAETIYKDWIRYDGQLSAPWSEVGYDVPGSNIVNLVSMGTFSRTDQIGLNWKTLVGGFRDPTRDAWDISNGNFDGATARNTLCFTRYSYLGYPLIKALCVDSIGNARFKSPLGGNKMIGWTDGATSTGWLGLFLDGAEVGTSLYSDGDILFGSTGANQGGPARRFAMMNDLDSSTAFYGNVSAPSVNVTAAAATGTGVMVFGTASPCASGTMTYIPFKSQGVAGYIPWCHP